jgi:hypothetical protein
MPAADANSGSQAPAAAPVVGSQAPPALLQRLKHLAMRLAAYLFAFFLIGLIVNFASMSRKEGRVPSGFFRGMIHGAAMPVMMPHLFVGLDPVIYDPNNNGRLYKLGYTVGVNGCGAIFFGATFWRFSRWRRNRNAATTAGVSPGA